MASASVAGTRLRAISQLCPYRARPRTVPARNVCAAGSRVGSISMLFAKLFGCTVNDAEHVMTPLPRVLGTSR